MDSSKTSNIDLYIPSIVFIVLIYLSLIVTGFFSLRYFKYNKSQHDYFLIRNPRLNGVYISTCLFILYILIPLVLITSHITSLHSYAPLIITEMVDLLLFLSFYMRTWVLWLDRIFVEQLQYWMWRREVNHQDSNFLIRHRQILKSSLLVISLLFLFLFIPIFALLQILQYLSAINQFNLYLTRTVLLFILWCCTYALVKQISPVFDTYCVRCELLQSLWFVGITYMISHIVYLLLMDTVGYDIALFIKLVLFAIANLCIIYCACYSSTKEYRFRRDLQTANMIRNSSTKASFVSLLPKALHFKQVMNSKQGFLALCNHLQHEISLETILFLLEVTQFKGVIFRKLNGAIENNVHLLCDPGRKDSDNLDLNRIFDASSILDVSWLPVDPRMHSAEAYSISLYIYDKYIEESADLCINISYETRKNIYRYFQELHTASTATDILGLYTIFDAAFKETWNLIATDSYFRFRTTDEFMKMVECLCPEAAKQAHQDLIKLVKRTLMRGIENDKLMPRQSTVMLNCGSHSVSSKWQRDKKETETVAQTPESKTITTTSSTRYSIKLILKNKVSNIMDNLDNFTVIPSESLHSIGSNPLVHNVDFMDKREFLAISHNTAHSTSTVHSTGHSTGHSTSTSGTTESVKEPHRLQYRLRSNVWRKKRSILRKSVSAPDIKIESINAKLDDNGVKYKTTDDLDTTQRVLQHEFMMKYRQQNDYNIEMDTV